jgi:hypothetical protein
MSIHTRDWEATRRLLREARDQIAPQGEDQAPSPVPVGFLTEALKEFEKFLEHNELELAWDALAELAKRSNAPGECWSRLARAAHLMGLTPKRALAEENRKRVQGKK